MTKVRRDFLESNGEYLEQGVLSFASLGTAERSSRMKLPKRALAVALISLIAGAIGMTILPKSSPAEEHVQHHFGLPTDWSTRHLIFTNGAPAEVVAAAGRDPRSWIQWARRSSFLFHVRGRMPEMPAPVLRGRGMRVDWAMSLGTAGGMAIGETPAKYSFDISGNYSCANDFVVYTIGATPSATQANIVAFNNLYTGTASSSCPFGPQTPPTTDFTQPTFMWSYRVGSGPVNLSPVLSLDGSKVAFVDSATHGMFDVLTWVRGQGTSATAPATPAVNSVVRLDYTNTTVAGCTANAAATNDSSAYVDYGSDSAYIGANNGELYRISGVFNGTPTVQYCITVKAGTSLTSPVYDPVTNRVFVSDGHSVYAYSVGATSFTLLRSIAVASAAATGNPIILSPIVDSSNGFVYVFSAADSTNAHTIVSQMDVDLTTQTTANLGLTASQFILDGDFDNAYFTTGPKAGAGTLYVCGTQANSGTKPSLYALSFSAPNGIMNSTPAMSDNRNINGGTNPAGSCSPLLDFDDGTNDRLFVGTGNYTGTGGANLVTEWNVNTRIPSNTTTPTHAATGEWGGSSAFTIDNVSPDPQTTSIYFGTLHAPPALTTTPCGAGNFCAVKLTQSALQ